MNGGVCSHRSLHIKWREKMEIWKGIKGYEVKYQVSNGGRVRSLKTGIYMKPQVRKHGYLGVQVHGNGKNARRSETLSIHRCVAEAFIPNPDGKAEVNHINEDKTDNRVENLEWVTHQENSAHATRGERIGKANKNNPLNSSSVGQYDMDGNLIATYPSIHEAMRQTGIPIGCIWSVCEGKTKQSRGYRWEYINKTTNKTKRITRK